MWKRKKKRIYIAIRYVTGWLENIIQPLTTSILNFPEWRKTDEGENFLIDINMTYMPILNEGTWPSFIRIGSWQFYVQTIRTM